MRRRPDLLALTLACGLGFPAGAETVPMDCGSLVRMVEASSGYALSAPPAGDEGGWCVLDGAVLKGAGDQPGIAVKRLRLSGARADGEPVSLEIDLSGLKVTPKLRARDVDERLRSLMRLQTVDLRLSVSRNEVEDRLELREGWMALSGGTEARFSAEIEGAGLSLPSVALGALTFFSVEWKNDGRILRPAMEAAGEGLEPGASGGKAVDSAREALRTLAVALPATSLAGESADELDALIAALPQGRGRLKLDFASDAGIGAAQLGLLALSDDPASPGALARLFSGSTFTVDWQPGMAP